MKYWEDAILGRIFNKVGEEFELPPSEVKEMFEAVFMYTKEAISHPEMPKVKIPFLGTFCPSRGKLGRLCKYYAENETTTNPVVIEEFNIVNERIKKEFLKRTRKDKKQ